MAEASWPGTVARNEHLVLGHEPATPLFPGTQKHPQHDAEAVSTSYARKLAPDSATALQVNSPLFSPCTRGEVPFFAALKGVRCNEAVDLGYGGSPPLGLFRIGSS